MIKLLPRIAKKIQVADCWYWQGYINRYGYGQVAWEGSRLGAHRVVWELLVGPIPEGMQLDHLCKVRHCVNPDHLEVVTPKENTKRSKNNSCPKGHRYDTINSDGARVCRECRKIATRAYRRRCNDHNREDLVGEAEV